MKYCDGCGEKATCECPYCHAVSCDDAGCIPACDHDAREKDPTPYCSYGHRTKAQCDCGPIADNE